MEMRGRRYTSRAALRRHLGWLREIEGGVVPGLDHEEMHQVAAPSTSEVVDGAGGVVQTERRAETSIHPDGRIQSVLELPVSLPPVDRLFPKRLYSPVRAESRGG